MKKPAPARRRKSSNAGDDLDPIADILVRLVDAATIARDKAYAPYSKYRVGAAIATDSGLVYVGCNVENASYPAGICAERSAIATMIAAGDRRPIACAIVTEGEPATPCGICRQVLVEFAEHMPIVVVGLQKAGAPIRRQLELREIMPEVFRLPPKR